MPYRLHIPGERSRALQWTDNHSLSSYGVGVLLYRKTANELDGATFRMLRDTAGAWLETDKPDQARRALRLPLGESLGEAPRTSPFNGNGPAH